MNEAILQTVEGLVTTPCVYLALFGIALLDGFFPLVPSETLVITLGVFAASTGDPNLVLIVPVAALGAFAGDHISYLIGRRSGPRIFTKLKPDGRARKAYDRVGRLLDERGGLVLVVARYIPGGRTAATLTTGATGFPLRTFTRYTALAAATWAVYSVGIGYVGGAAFEHDPLKGVALGLGMAFFVTVAHEAVRWIRHRRALTHTSEGGEAPEQPASTPRTPEQVR
ncbi:DedA family protein [Streptomyces microflavus]|uniref:DedA family protein n=1 Tax=Streptomyces microflavus TaxID=1919 RepID=UPI00366902EB